MGTPDHLTCLLRNLYADQVATVRTGHGTTDWFQNGKGVHQVCILSPCLFNLISIVAQTVKCLPTMWETQVQSLGQEDLLEMEMATHSSILAWKIPWTGKPGRLQVHGDCKELDMTERLSTKNIFLKLIIFWNEFVTFIIRKKKKPSNCIGKLKILSVQFSCSVVSDSATP